MPLMKCMKKVAEQLVIAMVDIGNYGFVLQVCTMCMSELCTVLKDGCYLSA